MRARAALVQVLPPLFSASVAVTARKQRPLSCSQSPHTTTMKNMLKKKNSTKRTFDDMMVRH